jgi:hypothetical protein
MSEMIGVSTFNLRSHSWLLLLASVAMIAPGTAQNEPSPPQNAPTSRNSDSTIAGAARDAKAQKISHAKKVFTDEDMEATAGPLPRLTMDGAENADEVVTAIAAYKPSHTPQQTEQAVRTWYDRYDQMLAAAIQSNLDMKAIRQANLSNLEDLCQQSQDYQECQNRRMAEYRGQRDDQVEMAKNNNLEVHIQHAFGKVRIGLAKNGLRYDWFKVRTTNGIDIF